MSGERVSTIEGKMPVLVVAPHGEPGDDINTDIVAERIAYAINAYAVINHGWCRNNQVDEINDKADCNNVGHMIGVVKDEFLDPIVRFRNRILKKYNICFMYMIHGMDNSIRNRAGDNTIEMIVGYGAGTPASYSCAIWRKDLFIFLLQQSQITCYEGKAGGTMSGWSKSNMNQLFRKHIYDPNVQSMQIEIIRDLRADRTISELTTEYLASAIKDLTQYGSWSKPSTMRVKQF